jgi:signal transduction histidine kinase
MALGRVVSGSRARTIRLRLTAMYAGVFLICGAALLTLGYLLVRRNLVGRHPLHVALRRLGMTPDHATVFAPGSRTERLIHEIERQVTNQALHTLLLEYVGALVLMTLLSSVIGWLLAGRALAPLRHITATARRVSSENLGERIALRGPDDELKELADTFDGMLGRLDAAFASQRHFVASASHELRTPLAIMRTEVDVALADPDASADELRSMGEALREMVDRCERPARRPPSRAPNRPIWRRLPAIASPTCTPSPARRRSRSTPRCRRRRAAATRASSSG